LAILAQRHLGAQLAHQARFIGHEPAFGDLAVGKPEHRHFLELEFLAGRRDAQKVALMGAADAKDHADPIALRNHGLDHVGAVGKCRAQIRTRARKVLVLRVLRQMLDAGAQSLGARRRKLALDGGFVLGALRFLEAANHVFIAFEVSGQRLRGHRLRAPGGQRQAGTDRAGQQLAAAQHGACRPRSMLSRIALKSPEHCADSARCRQCPAGQLLSRYPAPRPARMGRGPPQSLTFPVWGGAGTANPA
jgi:hypothetical protein